MNYYTKKEVAEILGCTDRTIQNYYQELSEVKGADYISSNTKRGQYNALSISENMLKDMQVIAQRNIINQSKIGRDQKCISEVSNTRKAAKQNLQMGLALNVLVQSGNVEAVQEYCNEIMQYTMRINTLSEEKKQLLEENDQLQAKNRELQEDNEWLKACDKYNAILLSRREKKMTYGQLGSVYD